MPDTTKREVIAEAWEKTAPIKDEIEKRRKKLIENAAVVISFSVIALSIILYAFNKGYSRVFNLPPEVMSLDMTRMIPLAVQILSVATCGLFYASSIKADRALKKNRIDFVRILWGAFIVSYFFTMNNVSAVIGRWWNLVFIYALPLLVEVLRFLRNKPRKNKVVTEAERESVLEDTVKDTIFATYYIKYGVFLVALPLALAPLCGEFSAKAEREYQTCVVQDVTYAVIVDYSDRVLAQQATEENNILTIDTTNYAYLDKGNIVLQYSKYESVNIGVGPKTTPHDTQNDSWIKIKEVLRMPSITDWLMVIITFVYVIATVFICVANVKSAKASKEQLAEAQKQYKDSNRPYVTCEYILTNRIFCGIRICNHGNQVARNLKIKINKNFFDSITDNEFGNFHKINDSVYSVVGIEQCFDFYFSSVNHKPTEIPLIASVTYEGSTDCYEEVFEIDLGKQLPVESVESDAEKYMKLLKEQNQILTKITK